VNKVTNVEESEGRREFDNVSDMERQSDMLEFFAVFLSPVICRHPEGAAQSGTPEPLGL